MASKRPYDRSPKEQNGRKKQMKTAPSDGNPSPGTIVFRLLCPSSKFGSLVGRGGSIVTKIRQETGAKIKIEDSVAGSEERVVVVTGSDKDNDSANRLKKDTSRESENINAAEGDDGSAEEGEGSDQKFSETAPEGKVPSSAERALLLVFDRIASNDSDGGDDGSKDPSSISLRMLILSSQVGCILGKGGGVIKQMSAESGAEIRILPKEKIPPCASANDELLQISGQLGEVKKALQSVCHQLIQNPVNPNRDFASSFLNRPSGPPLNPFPPFARLEPHPEMLPPSNFHPLQGPPGLGFPPRLPDGPDFASSAPKFPEGMIGGRLPPFSPEPITYRLLCVNDKVGSIIGKGGSIIKKLHNDTGCEIKVLETAPDSEDRVITITGPVLPEDRISPPQDAALRLLGKIVTPTPDNKENLVLTRMLVSSSQIGCLIGKAGSIIAEMRRMCGAHIRVLGKDQMPKYVLETDELVQVSGEFEAVQEAVVQITSRLKHHLFRDRIPSLNHPPHPPFADQAPPYGAFMGRREPSPPGSFSSFGPPAPSFRKFDSFGGPHPHDERPFGFPPVGGPHPHDERPFGFPPVGGDRLPPPGPWIPSGANEGGPNPMAMRDQIGVPPLPRRIGVSGNPTAVITNTTVDVVVPSSIVPSIYGEDGFSLKQIRQISGANITINDPKPGATETTIIISGAPDQTHAAQSLIQAFVMSESGSP